MGRIDLRPTAAELPYNFIEQFFDLLEIMAPSSEEDVDKEIAERKATLDKDHQVRGKRGSLAM
jgi:hypothetical protein